MITDWNDTDDLDLNYLINVDPTGSLYYLEWKIATDNPMIQSSDSFFQIFSPPMQLHHRALELESHFGISAVPEPGTVAVLGVASVVLVLRRRAGPSTKAV